MINDPFAEPLVRRVGIDFCTKLATGELQGLRADAAKGMRAMIDWMAVRTKYFDDFFLNAARDGIRQAVIGGLRIGCPRLPVAVGARHHRVRSRPAAGD